MENITQGRCYYLDLAKVIGTFLVIFGHLYSENSEVRLYIYAFHMPLFFLISGVFHKYEGKINWRYYFKSIIWPMIVFMILLILTRVLFLGDTLANQLRHYFVEMPMGKMYGILWFLYALFWCKVCLDIFLGADRRFLLVPLWAALLFIPVLINITLPLGLLNGIMALPFYFIGFYGKKIFLERKESIIWIVPFLLFLFLTVSITKLHGRVSMSSIWFGNLINSLYGEEAGSLSLFYKMILKGADVVLFYLNGLIGSFMVMSLSLLPFPKTKLITSLSQSLITVVGTQYLIINFIDKYVGLDNGFVISCLLSIAIFLICYSIHQLLKPIYKIFDIA